MALLIVEIYRDAIVGRIGDIADDQLPTGVVGISSGGHAALGKRGKPIGIVVGSHRGQPQHWIMISLLVKLG